MKWLDSITDSKNMNLSKLWEIMDRGAWRAVNEGVTKSQTLLRQLNKTKETTGLHTLNFSTVKPTSPTHISTSQLPRISFIIKQKG